MKQKLKIKAISNLKMKLFLPVFFLASAVFPIQSYATTYQGTARAVVQIGTVSSNCPRGWPTTGYITQGPMGNFSHGDPPVEIPPGEYEALDIGTDVGTPVYATVSGQIKNIDKTRTALDQRFALIPNCPGLSAIYYMHLSEISVNEGQTVRFGEQIGLSGYAGSGAHTHYQFNEYQNRTYSVSEPPHVPISVPRYCVSAAACGIQIRSAP